MKKILLTLLGLFVLIIFFAASSIIYVNTSYPNVGEPPDITVDISDTILVERGKYLANHVSVCTDCHSERDFSKFSGPIDIHTLGMGGDSFTEDMGFPGNFYAQNITPSNLESWTDGEILRAMVSGVNKDGKALFPIMPYPAYSHLTEYDAKAIIAYIRNLKPLSSNIPKSNTSFPFSVIIKTIPKKAELKKSVDKSNIKEYGKYLTSIAGCADCHTTMEKGEPLVGMDFAGGNVFGLKSGGFIRSANITPDIETGIGGWTKDEFIFRFKEYKDVELLDEVQHNTFNTIMPWSQYAGMTEEDLEAIFEYLKTLYPVKNHVELFSLAIKE